MNNRLQKRIMAQVYVAYLLRRVFSFASLKALVSLFALFELFELVSWKNVFFNAVNIIKVGSVSSLYDFSTFAITHTAPIVQVSLALVVVVAITQVQAIMRKSHGLSAISA